MRRMQIFMPFALLMLVLAATTTVAQTFSVLYNFGTNSGNPVSPQAPSVIAQGRDGNLYSTSSIGGADQYGTAFGITPGGTLTVLYNFDITHGNYPLSGLTLGVDGSFYGTAQAGGNSPNGVIFTITASGGLTVLYNFTGGADGYHPTPPPVQGTDGNFYGTTFYGGAGYGTIYKITPSGTFTTLHQFTGSDGANTFAPLIQGTDGDLYGASAGDGISGLGTIFKITPTGTFTLLHKFDGTHGSIPAGPLVQGTDGSFYGTAAAGGTFSAGVVFKMFPGGVLKVLHHLNGTSDGRTPLAGLVLASDGYLYGTASSGGTFGHGTIYKISSKAAFSVLHNFDGTAGANPQTTLFQHTNGILYGNTCSGGTGTHGSCPDGRGDPGPGVFYSLNVGLGPFVSFLNQQSSGKVGASIGISGQGFSGTTGVSFGGTPATFTVSADTYLTATVPAGALTGSIAVTTPSATQTSNQTFRVTPQVKSFSPSSGPVGTPVTITGLSLTQTSSVKFGTKSASFTANSDTQVTAIVPTGARTGIITITTPGGIATSATKFTVTP